MTITAKKLKKQWGVQCKHALYRENGTRYHCLKAFPGVLFDKKGFMKFDTKEQYYECKELKIYPLSSKGSGHCTAAKGISSIHGYTVMSRQPRDTMEDVQAQLDCVKDMIASLESRLQRMDEVDKEVEK
jgi:hypothetical protein